MKRVLLTIALFALVPIIIGGFYGLSMLCEKWFGDPSYVCSGLFTLIAVVFLVRLFWIMAGMILGTE